MEENTSKRCYFLLHKPAGVVCSTVDNCPPAVAKAKHGENGKNTFACEPKRKKAKKDDEHRIKSRPAESVAIAAAGVTGTTRVPGGTRVADATAATAATPTTAATATPNRQRPTVYDLCRAAGFPACIFNLQ